MPRATVLAATLHRAVIAALLPLLAACASAPAASEATAKAQPIYVSAAEIAADLQLVRHPLDDTGRIALTAVNEDAILIFPQTTVITVRGLQYEASTPVLLRNGEAWLTRGDASAIETLWSSPVISNPVAEVPPLDLPPWTPPRESAGGQPVPGGPVLYRDQPSAGEQRAWSVARLSPQWHYIVIHHSATDSGGAKQFDEWHKKHNGWEGLGYHFVIGNGTGSGDGAVEVGYRWREQKRGAHAGSDLYNTQGVGICLVGDFTKTRPTAAQMRSLARLTNFLSRYCGVPRDRFRLHGDVRSTACPGPLFPRDFLAPSSRTSGRTADEYATK